MNTAVPMRTKTSLVYQRQVEELYRHSRIAIFLSYFGAGLMLLLLIRQGEMNAPLYWFAYSTLVMLLRTAILAVYKSETGSSLDPRHWALLFMLGNILSGAQWGLLGTVLFPASNPSLMLFTVVLIISFVSGAATPFAALNGPIPHLRFQQPFPQLSMYFFCAMSQALIGWKAALPCCCLRLGCCSRIDNISRS